VTFRNRKYARQLIDFAGLEFGDDRPTDIDTMMEHQERCFVFGEFKHAANPDIPIGQKIALTRLCRAINRPTVLIHAVHRDGAESDIAAATAVVQQYYCNVAWPAQYKWIAPPRRVNVYDFIDTFLAEFGP
jgi:hypothetical protein